MKANRIRIQWGHGENNNVIKNKSSQSGLNESVLSALSDKSPECSMISPLIVITALCTHREALKLIQSPGCIHGCCTNARAVTVLLLGVSKERLLEMLCRNLHVQPAWLRLVNYGCRDERSLWAHLSRTPVPLRRLIIHSQTEKTLTHTMHRRVFARRGGLTWPSSRDITSTCVLWWDPESRSSCYRRSCFTNSSSLCAGFTHAGSGGFVLRARAACLAVGSVAWRKKGSGDFCCALLEAARRGRDQHVITATNAPGGRWNRPPFLLDYHGCAS